ncbi:MAG: SRPBCC family protein [Betaproteobacteria bacterium]|nr:SRPBCC family protein [Betaproteobacteria bacterium]
MSAAVRVDVKRTGRRFDAEAILELPASAKTVWETITDYDGLPGFMPGIRSCRVLEREAGAAGIERLKVEQKGEFRFLLFAQSMTVVVAIEHEAMRIADAKAISFDLGFLKRSAIEIFEGRYEILPSKGRGKSAIVPLRYTAVIGLKMLPPPSIGSIAVRQNLEAQLKAVAAEVARRSGRA